MVCRDGAVSEPSLLGALSVHPPTSNAPGEVVDRLIEVDTRHRFGTVGNFRLLTGVGQTVGRDYDAIEDPPEVISSLTDRSGMLDDPPASSGASSSTVGVVSDSIAVRET